MAQSLRLLHTADWHLGLVSWKALGGVERIKEQRECLRIMSEVAQQEQVDLIVHAGDLFHQYHQPPREAIALAVETILGMKDIAPFVWVMGNHDWYAVEALKEVFPDNVFIVKHFEPVPLPAISAVVYPLPYLSLARFLGMTPGKDIQDLAREKLAALFAGWRKRLGSETWNILTAHLTMEDLAGYAEVNATREVFLKPGDIPSGFHYGAFGHLHAHIPYQRLSFPLYYSSSLVRDNFGNESGQAGFLRVDFHEGQHPLVRPVFFQTSQLLTERLERGDNLEILRSRIGSRAESERTYVRVRYDPAALSPETVLQIKGMRSDNWRVVVTEPERCREASPDEEEGVSEVSMDTIPVLFERFCRENRLDGRVNDLFCRYYREVLEEEVDRASG
ncbi:MAG TPA: exonuclease SbcCD subunit D [Atribacteraceae bacterium]|nr:exonuclease SbcCD subunit D [Atribacteraceae bacterium]